MAQVVLEQFVQFSIVFGTSHSRVVMAKVVVLKFFCNFFWVGFCFGC